MQPHVICYYMYWGKSLLLEFPLLVTGCFIGLRAGRGNLKSRLIEESTKLSKTLENLLHACDATTELKKRNLCPQAILLITLFTRHFRFVACCRLVFLFWWLFSKSYWDDHASNFWSSCDLNVYYFSACWVCWFLIYDACSFQDFLLNCSVHWV